MVEPAEKQIELVEKLRSFFSIPFQSSSMGMMPLSQPIHIYSKVKTMKNHGHVY